ncbi:hypothetical protein BX600DRAFT_450658 [Xylariales sp. PMI_506]|nr:hypothetical protein BX600DRAFT_450658 [Xylariales sp. PMI_506]
MHSHKQGPFGCDPAGLWESSIYGASDAIHKNYIIPSACRLVIHPTRWLEFPTNGLCLPLILPPLSPIPAQSSLLLTCRAESRLRADGSFGGAVQDAGRQLRGLGGQVDGLVEQQFRGDGEPSGDVAGKGVLVAAVIAALEEGEHRNAHPW